MSERDKVLDKILGVPGAAAKLKKGVREMKATLDQHGLQHKALKPKARKGIMEDAGGKLDEVKAMLSEDPGLAQELLEFMMDLLGTHAEPDEDNAVAPEAIEEEFEAVEETEEAPETEMEPEPEEDFDEEEKAQPGYGEMEPDTSQELVNQAITKKPGTFPKPVSHQIETGKGKRGKSVKEPEWATAVKSLTQRLDDIEAAISELAALPERVEQLSPDTVFKAFAPRQASVDEGTVVTDPEVLKKAKQLNTQYDPFWGGTVQPK